MCVNWFTSCSGHAHNNAERGTHHRGADRESDEKNEKKERMSLKMKKYIVPWGED